jgi:hypothetical protein
MSSPLIHQLYAGIAPWAALSLLLLGRNPYLSRQRIIGSLLLAFFALRIQVEIGGVNYWSLFAWCRTLEMNPSFTLTGLLSIALWQRISGRKIFRAEDWSAAWVFGAIAALILYPMGLGLTSIDPYTWGWERSLLMVTALIAGVLLLAGNRFGILLLLPLGGFLLHLQESANFWDALIDPFYGAASLIACAHMLVPRSRGKSDALN